jgi:hypothetical protein
MATTERHGNYRKTWQLQKDMATTERHGNYRKTWQLQKDMAMIENISPSTKRVSTLRLSESKIKIRNNNEVKAKKTNINGH